MSQLLTKSSSALTCTELGAVVAGCVSMMSCISSLRCREIVAGVTGRKSALIALMRWRAPVRSTISGTCLRAHTWMLANCWVAMITFAKLWFLRLRLVAGEHDRFKISYGNVCVRRTDVRTAIGAEHHRVHMSACGSLQVTLWLSEKKLEGPF